MAITSRELRGRLEDAYVASAGLSQPTSLRAYLRQQEQNARVAISGGSVKVSTGDGKSVQFADYGPGQITQTELVELYRTLIDRFDEGFLFLTNCCTYGLDAFTVEFEFFPNNVSAVNPPNLIDSTGRWLQLCLQFSIGQATVIGKPVSDTTVFLWMMFNEVAALESRGDYSGMRVAEGMQFT